MNSSKHIQKLLGSALDSNWFILSESPQSTPFLSGLSAEQLITLPCSDSLIINTALVPSSLFLLYSWFQVFMLPHYLQNTKPHIVEQASNCMMFSQALFRHSSHTLSATIQQHYLIPLTQNHMRSMMRQFILREHTSRYLYVDPI